MPCIHGYFKKLHKGGPEYPFVKARIYVGGKEAGIIEFLVDTGGGITTISYGDALRLGIHNRVDHKRTITIVGAGGTERDFLLKSSVEIELIDSEDPNNVINIPLDPPGITVSARPKGREKAYISEMTRPSVLGWNTLKYSKITVDYTKRIIELCYE